MPGELTTFHTGSADPAESLRNLLEVMQNAHEADLSAEEKLNQIKIANATKLAALSSENQKKYLDAYEAAAKKQINAENKKHKRALSRLKAQVATKSGEELKALNKKIKAEEKALKATEKAEEKALKKRKQFEQDIAKERKKAAEEEYKQNFNGLFGKGKSFADRKQALYKMSHNEDGTYNLGKLATSLTNAVSDMAKQLDSKIDEIGKYKSAIDTRLYGSKNTKNWTGSYWDSMSKDITGMAGISPLVKQSDLANKVSQMVGQGIAFNVEQRATLAVLKDKIATTFDAANGTLLRLVRIQQQDTTAGRLGMEAALNAFLNNMYETTEYMNGIATTIKGSLEEAMSLMTGENALSFEYQVQKWLGSMYSVGMSDSAVQGLGSVIGKLASGQIDAITNGGQGNLVIMAANQAGLSVADILNNGLDSQTTNELMNSMVDYLAKIAKDAGDSKVIQQQMASVYGMTASDLKAAVNLSRSRRAVARDGLTYGGAINNLYSMANSMYARTSIGEMMTNAWDNFQYTMAAGIANNPMLYATYKAAGLLDAVAGGIAIPAISVMGNMVDLETTVADLMRVGAMSGSILSGIGSMIASGGNGGITGSGILKAAGISGNLNTVSRGNGQGLRTAGGASVSESGSLIGNSNSSDIQNATMTNATDSANAQLAEAVDSSEETKLSEVYAEVVEIYKLLQDVANGSYTIAVDVKNPSLKIDNIDLGL